MKKKLLLVLPLLAGFALSGCDLFGGSSVDGEWDILPKLSGGSKAQRTAICSAINDLSPCVNRSSLDLFPDVHATLEQDNGDYIRVTTKQVVDEFTVELEWKVDESQANFRSIKDSDGEHKIINVKYPGYGNPSTEFSWTLASAKCGRAKTKGDIATYSATLNAETHPHERVSIAQINAVTEGEQIIHGHTYPSTFDQVNYDQDSPYFAPNPDDQNPDYHYVTVKGKVIYYAPDGNWLLLADGQQVLEVYAGSGTPLTPNRFPAIANEYVEISGNLSQYNGNIQMGYVTIIDEIEKSEVTEPNVTGRTIDAEFINNNFVLPAPYVAQKQAIDGFSNSLGNISGTIVAGSLKNRAGAATTASALKNDRFTFEVDLNGAKIVVAYDYHTDADGSQGLFNKLKSKLTSGGQISLRGTMRYNGSDSTPFVLDGNPGVWNIVPFLTADVA